MALDGNLTIKSTSVTGGVSTGEGTLQGGLSAITSSFEGDVETLKQELVANLTQTNPKIIANLRRKADTMYELAVLHGYAGTEDQWIEGLIAAVKPPVDNCTTDDATRTLSARQGMLLDQKITKVKKDHCTWYTL